jgi:hypothetical protein
VFVIVAAVLMFGGLFYCLWRLGESANDEYARTAHERAHLAFSPEASASEDWLANFLEDARQDAIAAQRRRTQADLN